MPEMTGIELAQKLRALRPELPIVLATGYSDVPRAEASGPALPRLAKPFRQDDLAAAIARCRDGRKKIARRA